MSNLIKRLRQQATIEAKKYGDPYDIQIEWKAADEIERLVKHTNALEDLLKSWDRLMLHEFSGSPEAIREMTEISQKTAAVVWPESGRFKLSD